jgi:osmoprotectant transport system permease protein
VRTSDPFSFFFSNLSLFGTKTAAHLELSFASIGVAMAIALPLGVWLGHHHRGSFVAITLSNFGRALPSLAVISIGIGVIGIGFANTMVALVVLAGPVMLTNAYVGVDQVDPDVVQAARAMGMTRRQVLSRVELPLALPLLFTGVRIAAVTVVATAPIAAIAGGGGLGDVIVNPASYRLEGVLGACYCVMVLSAGVWILLLAVQWAVTPTPLRSRRVPVAGAPQSRKEYP